MQGLWVLTGGPHGAPLAAGHHAPLHLTRRGDSGHEGPGRPLHAQPRVRGATASKDTSGRDRAGALRGSPWPCHHGPSPAQPETSVSWRGCCRPGCVTPMRMVHFSQFCHLLNEGDGQPPSRECHLRVSWGHIMKDHRWRLK